jgi:hypothetical protein
MINIPLNILARGLHIFRKGTTTHCSNKTRQCLTGSLVPPV